jgi:uncharacterized protein DUF6933
MLVVRCTAKLLRRLNAEPDVTSARSTTRLGDWYATVLPTRPRHRILLVNEASRLPVLLPAREIATLGQRIPDAIARVLEDLGIDADVVDKERRAMAEVTFAKTASRSVLGTMNEFVFFLEHLLPSNPHLADHALGMRLGQVLVTVPPLGYQLPSEMATQILA